MYTFTVEHSVSCKVSARTSGHDDQFLNELTQWSAAMPKATQFYQVYTLI